MPTTAAHDLPPMSTKADVAGYLAISRRTLDRYVALGLIRPVRLPGGQPRFPRAEVERFLAEAAQRA